MIKFWPPKCALEYSADVMRTFPTSVRKPCDICLKVNNDPVFKNPCHLVHPVDETPGLFDIYGKAVCPICR
jgi:hypothetical protein